MGIITCRVSLDLKNDSNWKVNIRMYRSSGVTEQKLLPEAETTPLIQSQKYYFETMQYSSMGFIHHKWSGT